MPAPAPSAAGPSAALAGGSAQNRRTQPVAAPSSEQDRRSTTGSAPNQQPPRAGIVGARTKTEPHRAVRARLPEEGTAAPPTAPESARARRTRRHIPAEVRWSLLLPGPAHRRDLWLYPPCYRSTTSCRWRRAAVTTFPTCVSAARSITGGGTRAAPVPIETMAAAAARAAVGARPTLGKSRADARAAPVATTTVATALACGRAPL